MSEEIVKDTEDDVSRAVIVYQPFEKFLEGFQTGIQGQTNEHEENKQTKGDSFEETREMETKPTEEKEHDDSQKMTSETAKEVDFSESIDSVVERSINWATKGKSISEKQTGTDEENKEQEDKKAALQKRRETGQSILDDYAKLGEEVQDKELLEPFQSFITNNRKKRPMGPYDFFRGKHGKIDPPFQYSYGHVGYKSFFVRLAEMDQFVDSDNIQMVTHYLRKKAKRIYIPGQKCTLTDLRFDSYMDAALLKIKSGKFDMKKSKDTIYDQMTGQSLTYGVHWSAVDQVLFPMLTGNDHWVAGRFIFKERTLYIYNSYRKRQFKNHARTKAEKYAEVIPFYLEEFGIFKKRKDILSLEAYKNARKSHPLQVELVEDIPEQTGTDCGIFALTFMEYIIESKEFPRNFNVKALRTRLAFNLYQHGLKKREHNVETDDEDISV